MSTANPIRAEVTAIQTRPWPDALVDLYEQTYQRHVGVVYAMIGSRQEAEEVVQDAVMALRVRWDTVEHPAAYLRRMVINAAIGVLRRRETAERYRIDPPPPNEPVRLVELRDCLLRLPVRQRAAIVMRFVADLDDDEIADALRCRPATVRSLVHRGLSTLRAEVTP